MRHVEITNNARVHTTMTVLDCRRVANVVLKQIFLCQGTFRFRLGAEEEEEYGNDCIGRRGLLVSSDEKDNLPIFVASAGEDRFREGAAGMMVMTIRSTRRRGMKNTLWRSDDDWSFLLVL
jgi:hypothetical protein